MQIGPFELQEPLPQLREPHLLTVLRPWVDVGSTGTLAMGLLEERWQAQHLGQLTRPSAFYDLTRYRPMLYRREEGREIVLPNSYLRYMQHEGVPDLLVLHALEPHIDGEVFVESVAEVMERLGVRRFCMIGGMYAPMPHTRPLAATGAATDPALQSEMERLGVRKSTYEGPTSIVSLVTEEARRRDIGAMTMLIQIPSYAQLEEDYMGQYTLLRLLEGLYGFYLDLDDLQAQGQRQYQQLDQLAHSDSRLQEAIQQLESAYDSAAEAEEEEKEEPSSELAPEIEDFLRDMERRSGGEA